MGVKSDISILIVMLFAGCGDMTEPSRDVQPSSILDTTSVPRKAEWGVGEDAFFAVPRSGHLVQVWKWSGNGFISHTSAPCGAGGVDYAWLPNDRTTHHPAGMPDSRDVFVILDTIGREKECLPNPPGWDPRGIRLSRNGRYLSVHWVPGEGAMEKGFYARDGHACFSVARTTDPIGGWMMTTAIVTNQGFRTLVSDDGVYLVAAENKLSMFDVGKNRLMWEKEFGVEVGFQGLAFSLDSKKLYAGGTMARVICIDVEKGERIGKPWVATDSGEPIYGQRIEEMAISGDGKYLAAGTGPYGDTYVWRIGDGKLVLKFRQGGMFGVLFSPDSTHVAAFGGGSIKVWKIPVDEPAKQQTNGLARVKTINN